MWGTVDSVDEYLKKAIEFTGNHELYGKYMMKVVFSWPVSCENALTDYSINRNAWIGRAAVALYMKCPENITRKAWGYLTDEQQLLANNQARRAIERWEYDYRESKGLQKDLGGQMLLFGYS